MSILHGHNDVVRKVTWEPSGSFLVRPFYPHVSAHMPPADSYL